MALGAGISAMLGACGVETEKSTTSGDTRAVKQSAPSAVVAQRYSVRNLPRELQLGGGKSVMNDAGAVCGALFYPDTFKRRAVIVDGDAVEYPFGESDPNNSYAMAINRRGWITGYAVTGDDQRRQAFFYDGATVSYLGTFGADQAQGTLINDSGKIAGLRSFNDGRVDTFLYSAGTGTVLGMPAGAKNVTATSMNNRGEVVGYFVNASISHGFFSTGQERTEIAAPDAKWNTYAGSINDQGQITTNFFDGSTSHAFRYQDGALVDLNATNDPSNASIGLQINASGEVIGYSDNGIGKLHAFTHNGTTRQSLGTLGGSTSIPNSINDAGLVVGNSLTSNDRKQHAFIWSRADGVMIDLNDRIDPSLNIELNNALEISNSGIILAHGSTGYVLLRPDAHPDSSPTLGTIHTEHLVRIGSAVNASVQFTDVDPADTHAASWSWDASGTAPVVSVTEPKDLASGTVTARHAYTAAGVYNISVTVTDSAGKGSSVGGQVVVYDPKGGFVAGGGWITSPIGAYKADPTMGGRANFGFTSKYLKGAARPRGQTEFQFQSANLNFHSTDYDWLVVSGARAQYKGTGTINGSGSYKFLLTAVDGDLIGRGTPDRFRMRIWHYDDTAKADVIDYDNQLDSGTEGGNLEGTAIGGGSISIKTK